MFFFFCTFQLTRSMATLVTAMVFISVQPEDPGGDLEEETGQDFIRERTPVYCSVLMASGVLSFLLAVYQILLQPVAIGPALVMSLTESIFLTADYCILSMPL